MMRTTILALALTASAFGAAACGAQTAPAAPPPPGGPGHRGGMMMRADADHDRVITRAEAIAEAQDRAARRFDRLDTNHDGKLDRAELAHAAEMRRDRHREMEGDDMPPPPPPPAGKTGG